VWVWVMSVQRVNEQYSRGTGGGAFEGIGGGLIIGGTTRTLSLEMWVRART